jgi:uroporphyrinogen decarboxylase
MNERERFVGTLLFAEVDRIPLHPGGGRRSTLERWHREGLPENTNPTEQAYREAGGTEDLPRGGPGFGVDERMVPQFEEAVLEVRPNSQVVRDWKGNVCEIGLEYSTEYLRHAIDFVTRRWIRCPVENRDDWEAMKERYDPDAPQRLPDNPGACAERLAERAYPVVWSFPGPFWQLREWLGFERLCMLFVDDPEWLRDMLRFWGDYLARLLENGFRYMSPDMVHLSEDMAYKEHAMISPAMTREFLLPLYRQWGEIVRANGCPLYAMDSDGHVGELIPVWLEAGINVCDPMEVAAGNDIVRYRECYGSRMAFQGGVDKRLIAKGGAAIEQEMARLVPVIRSGGYVPSCDHGVPADVSWPDYVRYVQLLAQATGWL